VIARHRFLIALTGALALAAVSIPVNGAPAPKPAAKPAQAASTKPGPTKPGDEVAAAQAESAAHSADGVAAVVNDSVISTYDLRQRVALFVATSNGRPTDEQLKAIRPQILKQLETERLQLLEAQKNNITVSAEEVDKAIENIVKDNHLQAGQLEGLLARADVAIGTLRAQIAAQIAWAKTVQGQYGDRVHVTKEEIDAEMGRINAGANKPHFAVSEIFESVDSPEQESKVLKDMQNLKEQLSQGAPFPTIARQFSQNPTAAQGGDLGIIQEGEIPKEIYDALLKMRIGEVSEPIRSVGGFYIIGLRDRLESPANMPKDAAPPVDPNPSSLALMRVLLPIGAKPPKELVQQAGNAAMALRSRITSCAMVSDIPKQMKGVQVFNLGTMRLADLSAEMQSAIKNTPSGGVTAPLLSSAGIELLVRCDRAVVKPHGWIAPTRDSVENQLFEDKMGVFSRQYMRDLRRTADVEDKKL
jgi:peptidyl-prolyl cis-trans isomerase SurA